MEHECGALAERTSFGLPGPSKCSRWQTGRKKPSDFGAWPPLDSFVSHVWSDILAPLYYLPFYLPADRTGVMHAHRMVVSALIQGAATSGLHPTPPSPLLSGVLADFLDQLLRLSYPEQRKSPYDFGTPLETALLGGSVEVESAEVTHYPRFTYRPDGWKDDLPLDERILYGVGACAGGPVSAPCY